jgi:DNA-binding transcriptional MerR regulator
MTEELISKKEVLELTGISYGQFYRWKREGLIPESWFIRKSTFTGQETFLPKAKILERLEKIKSMKDGHSLDEIANLLSPEVKDRRFARDELTQMGWASPEVLAYYEQIRKDQGPYSFRDIFYLVIIEHLRERDLTHEEIELALSTLLVSDFGRLQQKEFAWTLVVFRKEVPGQLLSKLKVGACVLHAGDCLFDPQAQIVAKLELSKLVEDVKPKLAVLDPASSSDPNVA